MNPKTIEHTSLHIHVVIKDVITQGDLEKFDQLYQAEPGEGPSVRSGKNLRAAIGAGWILEPTWKAEDVAEMDPRVVMMVAEQIARIWLELRTIPPN
jgi:hypothetical protein